MLEKTVLEVYTKFKVHFYQEMLPEILWDTYTAVYRHLMAEAAGILSGSGGKRVLQCIEAERFVWERLLDAPFGSLELIRSDEALRTIDHAVSTLRRRDRAGNP